MLANKFHFWLEKIANIDDDSFICNNGSDGYGDRNVMAEDKVTISITVTILITTNNGNDNDNGIDNDNRINNSNDYGIDNGNDINN